MTLLASTRRAVFTAWLMLAVSALGALSCKRLFAPSPPPDASAADASARAATFRPPTPTSTPTSPNETDASARGTARAARGDCAVDVRLREILAGDPAEPCGHLAHDAKPGDFAAARQCVLRAMKARRAFSVVMTFQGVDSRVEEGIAGHGQGDAFRAYWVHYDGCPSGCGDGDPHSQTESCAGLRDLSPLAGERDWPPIHLGCTASEPVDTCP